MLLKAFTENQIKSRNVFLLPLWKNKRETEWDILLEWAVFNLQNTNACKIKSFFLTKSHFMYEEYMNMKRWTEFKSIIMQRWTLLVLCVCLCAFLSFKMHTHTDTWEQFDNRIIKSVFFLLFLLMSKMLAGCIGRRIAVVAVTINRCHRLIIFLALSLVAQIFWSLFKWPV